MKHKVRKCLMTPLLVAMAAMMMNCNSSDFNNEIYSAMGDVTFGIFEGEWTVNKQIVDTARLVMRANREIQVRLPESYLIGLYYTEYTDKNNIEPGNKTTTIELTQQGYSTNSKYLTFSSETLQAEDARRFFVNCSFMVTINNEPFLVNLLSYENATAVMQTTTGQWTLGIPIDAFLIKNLTTGKSMERKLSIPATLYYNTKRRIG